VPEPMRPGWSTALRMSTSRLPHSRLVDIDARMELAAAQPVIVPDTIVIDGGKMFISDTFGFPSRETRWPVGGTNCDRPRTVRRPVSVQHVVASHNRSDRPRPVRACSDRHECA
jgi:hypothetical protein